MRVLRNENQDARIFGIICCPNSCVAHTYLQVLLNPFRWIPWYEKGIFPAHDGVSERGACRGHPSRAASLRRYYRLSRSAAAAGRRGQVARRPEHGRDRASVRAEGEGQGEEVPVGERGGCADTVALLTPTPPTTAHYTHTHTHSVTHTHTRARARALALAQGFNLK